VIVFSSAVNSKESLDRKQRAQHHEHCAAGALSTLLVPFAEPCASLRTVNESRRDRAVWPNRMNLNAVSLLFEENSLFRQNNSLLTFQNSLFR
jgi:hypothetical protein